ncbi:MAG: iron-containing alcohol dehydrogenase [Chloroflexi bacterium]|nr:iron-containing alcohol dehydrogenase [Chloroflexota bacterium]
MTGFESARGMLREFKGDAYIHGIGVLGQVGQATARLGSRAALVRDVFPGSEKFVDALKTALAEAGVELLGEIDGPAPNAPLEDLARVRASFEQMEPDVVMSFGGGSTIDVTKAAEVLRTLGGDIGQFFGTGLVSEALKASGKSLAPHVAIQTVASSGAHLTKYSNITNVETGQKKLIVDDSIVPVQPVFDYKVTFGAPPSLTSDGALDGVAHSLEVLYGAVGKPNYQQVAEVARESIGLVVRFLPRVLDSATDADGREALGLATDLGGYAIMLGGTNGGHLTSFSLVDVLSHGRACAIMNPYYTVFFAPAIGEPLRVVGEIFRDAGFTTAPLDQLGGRQLGMAVAEAMISFQRSIGFPTTLGEVKGFTDGHIDRALMAAKDPQLKMKLENMPVALTAEMVDDYMGPILQAAKTGDLSLIRNVS